MKTYRACASVSLSAALLSLVVMPASAQSVKEPINGQAAHIYYDVVTHTESFTAPAPSGTNVFVNTQSTPAWAYSSTDPHGAQIGDVGEATGSGLLHESDFTFYNGAASTSSVTSATVSVNFYEQQVLDIAPGQPKSPLIGNFSVNLAWPAGVDPGFYSIVTLLNMDSLGLNVPANQRMLEYTQTTSHVGGDRIGFVSFDTPTVGTDHQSMWFSDNTHPAGFYFFDNIQTLDNPGFRWNVAGVVAPEPASLSLLGLSALGALARRRR